MERGQGLVTLPDLTLELPDLRLELLTRCAISAYRSLESTLGAKPYRQPHDEAGQEAQNKHRVRHGDHISVSCRPSSSARIGTRSE
jgi:hypothetical protein